MTHALNLPTPTSSFVVPATGVLRREWWYWLLHIYERTGGATGSDFGPVVPVTLTASPTVYTASIGGTLFVSGSGMIRVEISKTGETWYSTGSWYGGHRMIEASKARLTYIGAPTVVFIPG